MIQYHLNEEQRGSREILALSYAYVTIKKCRIFITTFDT